MLVILDELMITIIMPIYNTGKYLDESIPSVLTQSYADFELLCVDDHSDDEDTLRILRRWEESDRRIRIIRNSGEKGAGAARNLGLKEARGEYIAFLDSDDIYLPDYLERAWQVINCQRADMAICSFEFMKHQNDNTIDAPRMVCPPGPKSGDIYALNNLSENSLSGFSLTPWNKVYSSEFLRNNDIVFQNLSSGNDIYFSVMCLLKSHRIINICGTHPLIKYRYGTSTQISANQDPRNLYRALSKAMEDMGTDADSFEGRSLYGLLLNRSFTVVRNCRDLQAGRGYYFFIRDYFRNNLPERYFVDERHARKHEYLLQNDFDEFWADSDSDFEGQLYRRKDELMSLLPEKGLLLWGCGPRGNAFLSFYGDVTNNAFSGGPAGRTIMVTDRDPEKFVSLTSDFDTDIKCVCIDVKDAYNTADVIVASNYKIYRSINEECEKRRITCIDLEQFCPWDYYLRPAAGGAKI